MEKFKAGNFKTYFKDKSYNYKTFLPLKINKGYEWNIPNFLLEKAINKLSNLNTYALKTPDISFFIKMYAAKEATTSSQIEGTKTKIKEVFMDKERILPEKRDDWGEVQNYIIAMNWAIKKLDDLPLSMRLIKGAHKRLLSGVRGKNKNPGEIRKTQNWIGGENLNKAFYIPPHPDDVFDLLNDLEKFWHNDQLDLPYLIKAGISHYQFETIHPFLDGNGRIGRLLITLYLIYIGVLDKPVLYLSDYFSKNRSKYFDCLVKVRENNDMEQWLVFFLKGVVETSEKGIKTLDEVISLKKAYVQSIEKNVSQRKQKTAKNVLISLFSDPIVSINEISDRLKITFPTANTIMEELKKNNIVKEITGKKRERRFELVNYIKIFND